MQYYHLIVIALDAGVLGLRVPWSQCPLHVNFPYISYEHHTGLFRGHHDPCYNIEGGGGSGQGTLEPITPAWGSSIAPCPSHLTVFVTFFIYLFRYLSIFRKKNTDNLFFACKMFFDLYWTNVHIQNFLKFVANINIWPSFSCDPHGILLQRKQFWNPSWGYLPWWTWLNHYLKIMVMYLGKINIKRLACTTNIMYWHICYVINTIILN